MVTCVRWILVVLGIDTLLLMAMLATNRYFVTCFSERCDVGMVLAGTALTIEWRSPSYRPAWASMTYALGLNLEYSGPEFLPISFFRVVPVWRLDGHPASSNYVEVPLAPLLLVAPAVALRHCVRRRRPASACVKCGYDLRGSISQYCPECGTEICRSQVAPAGRLGAARMPLKDVGVAATAGHWNPSGIGHGSRQYEHGAGPRSEGDQSAPNDNPTDEGVT